MKILFSFSNLLFCKKNLSFKIIALIFFLIASAQNIFAQPLINRLVKRGLEYGYNFNWNKSEGVFQNLIARYPNDPRGYHYESGIYLWRYLSNQDKVDLDNFVLYSDSAITKAQDILDKHPNRIDILYTLGATYSYRAIAFIRAQKFLDAVWATKKSDSYLSETLRKDSTEYDAYLGLGLYNFAVGQIPAAFKWALNLAGIHGNVESGLKSIKIAAMKGNLAKVEAEYYLAQILSDFFADYDQSSKYLRNLISRYPDNLLFNYTYAVLEIKTHNLNEASKTLSRILDNSDSEFKQLISFSEFLKGDIFFKKNEFDSCKTYYLNFLKTSPSTDYKGIAAYRLAVSYEITHERNEAVKYFKLTGDGNMDLEDDIYAKRKGEIFANRTMAYTEMDAIEDDNLIQSGRFKTAFDSLSALLERVKTDRLKAEVYIYLSSAAYYLHNYNESLSFALTAKVLNSEEEKWIKPYACYYAARASFKLKDKSAVKNFIKEAESYSDFDYQKKLKNLLFALSE